jgi:surface antigen
VRPSQVTTALLVLALALPVSAPSAAQDRSPLSSIFGCNSPGGKQAGGAVLGGVVGGLVGNKVAKHERGLGTALGAALGAAAGSYVGCRMQRSDQQRAELTARQALDQNDDVSWSNPDTGASGDVRMVSTRPYPPQPYDEPPSLSGIRLASGVEIAESYEASGGKYWAPSTTKLRASPSSAAPVIGDLRAGDSIDGLARVRGSNWLLVGRDRVGIGYVLESAVRPIERAPRDVGPVCRTFDQTIQTRDGEPETQRYTACKDPNGEWVIQR